MYSTYWLILDHTSLFRNIRLTSFSDVIWTILVSSWNFSTVHRCCIRKMYIPARLFCQDSLHKLQCLVSWSERDRSNKAHISLRIGTENNLCPHALMLFKVISLLSTSWSIYSSSSSSNGPATCFRLSGAKNPLRRWLKWVNAFPLFVYIDILPFKSQQIYRDHSGYE